MSLRAVLGTSLALILISPSWTAAAEHKARHASVASDRHSSPSRAARKEAAQEERPQKGRAQNQKEPSQKDSARKGRTEKEASQKDPAPKGRAEKEASQKETARNGRAEKEASQKEPAQKRRTEKETSRKEAAQNERARREAAQKEEARKEAAQKERARREAAQKEEARKEAARKEATLEALRQQLRDLRKEVDEVERLRAELAEVKAQVWGRSALKSAIWGGVPLTLHSSRSAPPSASLPRGSPEIDVLSFQVPDVRDVDPRPPRQPPVNPATAVLPAVVREQQPAPPPKSAVEEAKAYLVKTATPGYTMTRQGVSVAIDRLHPGFAVKLAEALKRARAEGLTEAGVYSAYRPPAFGVGGFRDKFDSLHSYGLATDISGIGRPGSASARRWHQIVLDVGLYLPYGPDNRNEFNHTQFVPAKIAPKELRETITADGPNDLREMWLASGVDAYVTEPAAVAVASAPGNDASADAGSSEPKPALMRPE